MSELDSATIGSPPPQPPPHAAVSAELPSPPPPPAAGAAVPPRGAASVPPRPPRRVGTFFLGLFSGCLVIFVGFFLLALLMWAARGDEGEIRFAASKVAIIPIDGEIVDSRETVEALHRYAANDAVKAIIVRINSPGGAIAPSQEIYEEIRKIRESSGKPVVASLDSVAASGGFYIASACDSIVANPGSITGSIGVILQWMETKDLLAWAKLKPETITSGAMKAAGSPQLELTAEQRAYFQHIVVQLHQQFVKAVAAGRKGKISEAEVAALADGRIFTGEEALSLKLIDQLGNLDDAVKSAAKLAGVKGRPGTIYPRRRKPGLFDVLTGSQDAESMLQRVVSNPGARFLYRWQ
jgi:protease-4